MPTKRVKMGAEFSSIFHDPKWLCEIKIWNFNSKRVEDNRKLYNKIINIVKKYNKKRIK